MAHTDTVQDVASSFTGWNVEDFAPLPLTPRTGSPQRRPRLNAGPVPHVIVDSENKTVKIESLSVNNLTREVRSKYVRRIHALPHYLKEDLIITGLIVNDMRDALEKIEREERRKRTIETLAHGDHKCPICCEDIKVERGTVTPCGHIMCALCTIKLLLPTSNTALRKIPQCPVCRTFFTGDLREEFEHFDIENTSNKQAKLE